MFIESDDGSKRNKWWTRQLNSDLNQKLSLYSNPDTQCLEVCMHLANAPTFEVILE